MGDEFLSEAWKAKEAKRRAVRSEEFESFLKQAGQKIEPIKGYGGSSSVGHIASLITQTITDLDKTKQPQSAFLTASMALMISNLISSPGGMGISFFDVNMMHPNNLKFLLKGD